MPFLDIADADGKLKPNATEVILATMHFPHADAGKNRMRYQSFLELKKLLKRLEEEHDEKIGPGYWIDEDNEYHDVSDKTDHTVSYEDLLKLSEARDFWELLPDPQTFYIKAYAASHRIKFLTSAYRDWPQFKSNEKWKFYFANSTNSLYRATGLRWTRNNSSLDAVVKEFSSVQHLWAACTFKKRFTKFLTEDAPKSGGKNMLGLTGGQLGEYNFLGRFEIDAMLAEAAVYQELLIAPGLFGSSKKVEDSENLWLIPTHFKPKNTYDLSNADLLKIDETIMAPYMTRQKLFVEKSK